jgi:hypothetical protein
MRSVNKFSFTNKPRINSYLNTENDFVLKRMRVLVSGKNNVRVFQQLVTDHITQGVVLLEKRETSKIMFLTTHSQNMP